MWHVESWAEVMTENTHESTDVETHLPALGSDKQPFARSLTARGTSDGTQPASAKESSVAGASRDRLLLTFEEAAELLGIGRTIALQAGLGRQAHPRADR